jgi:hypothetical protein
MLLVRKAPLVTAVLYFGLAVWLSLEAHHFLSFESLLAIICFTLFFKELHRAFPE